ncbi:hypothetical protein [Sphingopyxis sp.]|uniref:hypothetical protein n=1 Tax=Sphingopyxis sp. TaxID=1908224 RepID=UPI003D0DDC06
MRKTEFAAAACALMFAAVPVAANADAESDALFLDMAKEACANGDFSAFLWPYANSAPVRERYTAATVGTGSDSKSRDVPRADYLAANDFPILMIDYSYVTGDSARRFDTDGDASKLVYTEVEFNTAQDERQRVDWQPGRFEPGEGDGPGTLIEKTGPGGYLLFSPTADCWQLTADIREAPAAR